VQALILNYTVADNERELHCALFFCRFYGSLTHMDTVPGLIRFINKTCLWPMGKDSTIFTMAQKNCRSWKKEKL